MELFLAVFAQNESIAPEVLAGSAKLAVESISQSVLGPGYTTQIPAEGRGILIAHQRARATDTFFGKIKDKILYIQGCVEPINDPSNEDHLHLAGDKILPRTLFTSQPPQASDLLGLTGSYHLAIYDPATRDFFAVTDRLNSRPFFFYADRDIMAVASDIRALLSLPQVDREIDLDALAQFVRTQIIFGNRTLYAHIKTLMPATLLSVGSRGSRVESKTYWAMTPLEPYSSDREAIQETANAFEKAAKRITCGTQRSGILLSGGLDSRLMLALINKYSAASIHAYTFGPALTDEGEVAQLIARIAGVDWQLVTQNADDYWLSLEQKLTTLQGLYSLAHSHPFKTAGQMMRDGMDTIYHGLELCVTFSGSYLPKNKIRVLGRELVDYRLSPLRSTKEVKSKLLESFDIQDGSYPGSYLCHSMEEYWRESALHAFDEAVDQAAENWSDPYEQYEKAILHAGFTKFRSYIVATGNRFVARERTLMPDAEVIDAYLHLSIAQRFLGPIYRRSFRSLAPELADIKYPNIGTSAFASPAKQAIALQTRQFWRANKARAASILGRLGVVSLSKPSYYGSYSSSSELVAVLAKGRQYNAARVKESLTAGFLVQNGIIDGQRICERLDAPGTIGSNEATTLLALATLAAWFEEYPGEVRK